MRGLVFCFTVQSQFHLSLSSYTSVIITFLSSLFRPARLKNIDRTTAQHMVVTVGDVTVIITDYKPKPEATRLDESATSENMSFHESSDTDFSE